MKTIASKVVMAASVFALSASASAVSLFGSDIYIDTGDPKFGQAGFPGCLVCAVDADSKTGIFTEFGFSQFLATSVYDFSDGDILGAFFDTNDPVVLGGLGIPTSGTALDTVTTVSLTLPLPAQVDIDALSPLVPPLTNDTEGYLLSWQMNAIYTLYGTLGASGPTYNSGTIDLYFDDLAFGGADQLVLTLSLTGSSLTLANLDLFFDVTFAKPGFLWVDDGTGNFVDASTSLTQASLDTNVNPPFPTADQLLLVNDSQGNPNAIRQTTLDGSIGYRAVPVPGTLALLGLGLLGLGTLRKRSSM